MKPGCTLTELLKHRAERGHLLRDLEQYRAALLAKLALGEKAPYVVETADEREISIINQPMPNGGWVVTHEDITERRQAEAKISHMALHDALTNLPNRRFFHEQMVNRLSHLRDQKFEVLCLDLDRFKIVNDTSGILSVTSCCANLLHERMSARGRRLARLGGDEFAILQSNIEHRSI